MKNSATPLVLAFECSSRLSASLYAHILLASLLTPFPGAAWCIFNQGMSALTPSCRRNMLLCSCVKNSYQEVTWWKLLQPQSHCGTNPRFLFSLCGCMYLCMYGVGFQCMHFSGRHSTSCLLCDWRLTTILYISVPVIAKDKPIAANKRGVKLPEREKVIYPSSCPHLSANLDIFQHRNVKYFLSPFMPQ